MPQFLTVEIPVEEAARLFHVQPETVRRRLRSREIERAETIGRGEALVRLRPDAMIRVEDAAVLLHVTTSTVRAGIGRGRLAGERVRGGRWRVRLRSVLEDPRCDPAAVALFTTLEEVPAETAAERPERQHRLSRPVFVRLYEEELELLDRGRERHGSHRGAVVAGLRAIDVEGSIDAGELAAERDHFAEEAERARAAHAALARRAEGRLVDEVYCPRCERLVPIEDIETEESQDGSAVVLFHAPHGYHEGGRLRSSSIVGRRKADEHDPGV